MTLSQALVEMAPPDHTLSPEENRRRQDAITLVHQVVLQLGPRVVAPAYREAVMSDLVYRLMKNRPGPRRYTADDEGARAYLVRGLRNLEKDAHRRDTRHRERFPEQRDRDTGTPRGPEDEDFVDGRSPELVVQKVERDRLEAEATRVLFERALPAISTGLQNPVGFLANMADLRAIFDGALTVDAIVTREGGADGTYVTVRNRVYQRHKRARAYLLEVPRNKPDDVPRLSAWLATAGLRPELVDEVRRVAAEMFAPRVDRSDAVSQEQVS